MHNGSMHVDRTGTASFIADFETEQELRDEQRQNLSFGALHLPTADSVPPNTVLTVTLRGPAGGETELRATVVAALPNGLALAVEGNTDEIVARLLEKPAVEPAQSGWDRMRALSPTEKLLLSVKADRSERALLLQDNDPRVLLSLLRNPRLTVDEVVRLAKSPFLTYQLADVVMRTSQWMASLDVRLALIHNAKTPQAFALRILPSLPDAEVKAIARAGTSMALKQAALRRLQSKP